MLVMRPSIRRIYVPAIIIYRHSVQGTYGLHSNNYLILFDTREYTFPVHPKLDEHELLGSRSTTERL